MTRVCFCLAFVVLACTPLVAQYVGGAPRSSADTVVVFVHGFTGNAVETWTNRNGVSFPKLVATDFPDVDVYVYEYPTPLWHSAPLVPAISQQLRELVIQEFFGKGKRHVVFVCHSMGGIVAWSMLVKMMYTIPPNGFPMILCFATPHQGAEVPFIARLAVRNPQLGDMVELPSNAFLQQITDTWKDSVHHLQAVNSYCAYETLPTRLGLVTSRRIVSPESASAMCNHVPIPIPAADHLNIVKPASKDAPAYVFFKRAFEDSRRAWVSDDQKRQ